ncbi:MAG: hypothetical protein KAX31_00730 [Thermoplasmata archaeon]|nr:hypothetical protein [Thermoplasmata archaeon]
MTGDMKITDKEFIGWNAMTSLAGNTNYWIYFSPDNLEAALVNTINNQVIFIMDRKSGAQTYKCRNHQKHAQFFYAMKRPFFSPRKVT